MWISESQGFDLSPTGPGGLAETSPVAGGPLGGKVRRVGSPTSGQAHPPLPLRPHRGLLQDCLVSAMQGLKRATPLL